MVARRDSAGAARTPQHHGSMTLAFDMYEVLGYRVRVGVSDPVARQAAQSILGGFGPVAVAPDARFVPYLLTTDEAGNWMVAARGSTLRTDADFATALAALEWHILTDALARCSDLFHLHGAALSSPNHSGGIVLIGDSGSGKTTLTLGLMLRGFAPLSDDVTLLEPTTLAARPFRRAFHLEEGTRQILEGRDLPATWDLAAMPSGYFLPPRWAPGPVPIRCVLFPQYRPGAPAQLTRLTIPAAAATLLAHTISLAHIPTVALATVARLTASAGCYHFVSGELDDALDAIVDLMASQTHLKPEQPELAR